MEDKIKQFLKTIKLNEQMLSVLFGMVTVVLVGVLVFRMYKTNKPEITEEAKNTQTAEVVEKVGEVEVKITEEGKKIPTNLPETYTVKAGDDLWAIAEANYGSGYNWVEIAKVNGLKNPNIITEGQELKLPKVAVVEVKADKKVATSEKVSPNKSEGVQNKIEGDSYTVAKGDNLWDIAVRAYADGYKWVEIARENKLANPDLLEVGQKLKLARG